MSTMVWPNCLFEESSFQTHLCYHTCQSFEVHFISQVFIYHLSGSLLSKLLHGGESCSLQTARAQRAGRQARQPAARGVPTRRPAPQHHKARTPRLQR